MHEQEITRDVPQEFEGPLSSSTAAVLLYLSWLRALMIVGEALLVKFPTYTEWEAFLDDPETRRDVLRFAGVMEEIKRTTALGAEYDLEAIEAEGGRRTDALEALAGFADKLGVGADELLAILLHA